MFFLVWLYFLLVGSVSHGTVGISLIAFITAVADGEDSSIPKASGRCDVGNKRERDTLHGQRTTQSNSSDESWGFVISGDESVFPHGETCTPQSVYVEIWTVRPLDLSLLKVASDCGAFIPTIDEVKATDNKAVIKILFLPHDDGDICCSLRVSVGDDEKSYLLRGSAVNNQYAVAPVRAAVSVSAVMKERFVAPIEVYNPHDSPLQIQEIKLLESSENSHVVLELPTDGDYNHTNPESWQIKSGKKRKAILVTFQSPEIGTFYDFVRIKTDFDTLIIPVEIEVVKDEGEDGLSIVPSKLDFQNMYGADPKTLSLSLRNTQSVKVTTQAFSSPGSNLDPRLSFSYRSATIGPGQTNEFANITLRPTATGRVDAILRLVVNSASGSVTTLDVDISGNVVGGSLGFLDEQTKFQSGKGSETTRPFIVSNNFASALVIEKAVFNIDTILIFSSDLPITVAAGQQAQLGEVRLPALHQELSAPSLIVTTNLTTVSIPFSIYHGRLHCVAHPRRRAKQGGEKKEVSCGDFEWDVDLGSVSVSEESTFELEIINRNPVNVTIDSWLPGKNVQVVNSVVEDLETVSVPIERETEHVSNGALRIGPQQRLRLVVDVKCSQQGFGASSLEIVTMREERITYRFTYEGVVGSVALLPDLVNLSVAEGGTSRKKTIDARSSVKKRVMIYDYAAPPYINVKLLSKVIRPQTKSKIGMISYSAPMKNLSTDEISPFSEGLTYSVKRAWKRHVEYWDKLEPFGGSNVSTNVTFYSSMGNFILPVVAVTRRPSIFRSALDGDEEADGGLVFREGFPTRMVTVSNPTDVPLAACLLLEDDADFRLDQSVHPNTPIGVTKIVPPGGRASLGPITFMAHEPTNGSLYIRNNHTILERLPLVGLGSGAPSTLVFLLNGADRKESYYVRNSFNKPIMIRGVRFTSSKNATSRFSVNKVFPEEVPPGSSFLLIISYDKVDYAQWQEDMLISTSMGDLFVQLLAVETVESPRWYQLILPFAAGVACVWLVTLLYQWQGFLWQKSRPKVHPMSKILCEPEIKDIKDPDDPSHANTPRRRSRTTLNGKADTASASSLTLQIPPESKSKKKKAKAAAKKRHGVTSDTSCQSKDVASSQGTVSVVFPMQLSGDLSPIAGVCVAPKGGSSVGSVSTDYDGERKNVVVVKDPQLCTTAKGGSSVGSVSTDNDGDRKCATVAKDTPKGSTPIALTSSENGGQRKSATVVKDPPCKDAQVKQVEVPARRVTKEVADKRKGKSSTPEPQKEAPEKRKPVVPAKESQRAPKQGKGDITVAPTYSAKQLSVEAKAKKGEPRALVDAKQKGPPQVKPPFVSVWDTIAVKKVSTLKTEPSAPSDVSSTPSTAVEKGAPKRDKVDQSLELAGQTQAKAQVAAPASDDAVKPKEPSPAVLVLPLAKRVCPKPTAAIEEDPTPYSEASPTVPPPPKMPPPGPPGPNQSGGDPDADSASKTPGPIERAGPLSPCSSAHECPPTQGRAGDSDEDDNFDFLKPPPNIEESAAALVWDEALLRDHFGTTFYSPNSDDALFLGKESDALRRSKESDFPSKESDSVFPSKESDSVFPSKESESVFPSKESDSVFPSKESDSVFPSKESDSVFPSKESDSPMASLDALAPMASLDAMIKPTFPTYQDTYQEYYPMKKQDAATDYSQLGGEVSVEDSLYYSEAQMYAAYMSGQLDEAATAEYLLYQQQLAYHQHMMAAQMGTEYVDRYGGQEAAMYNTEFYPTTIPSIPMDAPDSAAGNYMFDTAFMEETEEPLQAGLEASGSVSQRKKTRRRANNLRRAKEKKKKNMEERESMVSNQSAQSEDSMPNFDMEPMHIALPKWPEDDGGLLEGLLADLHRGSSRVESAPTRHQWK